MASIPYPASTSQRNKWISQLRPAGSAVDPLKPYAYISEIEPDENAVPSSVATIFLTNRECPWKCVMCDLWKNTLPVSVPRGAILQQINFALDQLPDTEQIKLYNSGSFFDPNAIPTEDLPAIAERIKDYKRVIVESHPALIGLSAIDFQKQISGQLEIAIGLETACPPSLEKINKGMTLEQFSKAANFLYDHEISLRVFLLVHPPFISSSETESWIYRSIDFAFENHARVISLIPTRSGNGATDELMRQGQFTIPKLADLEKATDYAIKKKRGIVFADIWDLELFSNCDVCFNERKLRLDSMNQKQRLLPKVNCQSCGGVR